MQVPDTPAETSAECHVDAASSASECHVDAASSASKGVFEALAKTTMPKKWWGERKDDKHLFYLKVWMEAEVQTRHGGALVKRGWFWHEVRWGDRVDYLKYRAQQEMAAKKPQDNSGGVLREEFFIERKLMTVYNWKDGNPETAGNMQQANYQEYIGKEFDSYDEAIVRWKEDPLAPAMQAMDGKKNQKDGKKNQKVGFKEDAPIDNQKDGKTKSRRKARTWAEKQDDGNPQTAEQQESY